MADNPILLGIITTPDDEKYYFASLTYVSEITTGVKPFVVTETVMFYGDIPSDKPIAWSKEMGFFVWGRQSKQTVGDLWLFNESQSQQGDAPGRYDDLLLGQSRDSKLEYFIVNDGNEFSSATKVGEYLIDSVSNPASNYIVVTVVDKLTKIDKNTEHLYFDNALPFVDNREQPRPIVIGRCNQMPLTLIDDVNNRYEVHFESTVNNLIDVYDTADVFVYPVDYSKGTDAEGGYGVDLANPVSTTGVITAHCNGGEYSSNSTRTFNIFCPYLLVTIGGMDAGDINTTSLSAVHSEWNFKYCAFIPNGQNIRQILEQAMLGHCGYVYQNNDGEITFDWVKPPAVTADHELNSINIESNGIKIKLDNAQGLSDGVAWRKNWHVFSYSEVKDVGITEEERQIATKEFVYYYRSSTTTSGSPTFHDTYAHARHGDYIQTLIDATNDGVNLITHLEDELYDVERHFYEFGRLSASPLESLAIQLGETIQLNDPRFFPSGKNTLITRIEGKSMLSNIIEFETWG